MSGTAISALSDPDAFTDLLRQEPLHPDLIPYLQEVPRLGQVLRHPLVYDVPHSEATNALCNLRYAANREAIERARQEKDWLAFILTHEPPWRADALADIAAQLDDATYWHLLGGIWVSGENQFDQHDLWLRLWSSPRSGRSSAMGEADRATLAALPDRIHIYRGCREVRARHGLSWTISRASAIWFAHRWKASTPLLISGWVQKTDVLAYFDTDEHEIVVLPQAVQKSRLRRLSPSSRPDR